MVLWLAAMASGCPAEVRVSPLDLGLCNEEEQWDPGTVLELRFDTDWIAVVETRTVVPPPDPETEPPSPTLVVWERGTPCASATERDRCLADQEGFGSTDPGRWLLYTDAGGFHAVQVRLDDQDPVLDLLPPAPEDGIDAPQAVLRAWLFGQTIDCRYTAVYRASRRGDVRWHVETPRDFEDGCGRRVTRLVTYAVTLSGRVLTPDFGEPVDDTRCGSF